jgi:hypothetical protein
MLGEHNQVRAAPALQLNFRQHVFTILKQHGKGKAEVGRMKYEVSGILIRSHPLTQPLGLSRLVLCSQQIQVYAQGGPSRTGPKAQPRKLSGQTRRRKTVDGQTLDLRPSAFE